MVVAHKSSTEEIGLLRNIFEKHVSHHDGAIWMDDFFSLMKSSKLSQEELNQIFDAMVSPIPFGVSLLRLNRTDI
jgi:hypothetical protein